MMKNRRVNLLFIVDSLDLGGAEKHAIELLNSLDTTRFRLSLAYLKSEYALLPQLLVERLKGGLFCCNVSKKVDMRAVRQLVTHIRDESVDIVVCSNTYPLLYGWLARIAAGRKTRLVEVFHTTELDTMKSKFQMLFYRPLFRACDMLVYVCENQKKYWRSKGLSARQDTVIHNGIDIERYADRYTSEEKNSLRQSFGFGPDDFMVGLCALLRPEKAHGDLLQAIASLRAGKLDVKCLFIGDGPERSRLESTIEAMGLAAHVGITGILADVRGAIAACDVMALVSHHETFSIAALESMALGKPMIMSEIGGAAEQVMRGKNGYLYQRGDINALAHAVQQSMESTTRGQMGDHARATVAQKFSLATMVDAYERLFVGLADWHA